MTRLHVIAAAKFFRYLPCVGQWTQGQGPQQLRGYRAPRQDGPRSWVVAVAAFASMFFSIGLSFGTVGVMTVAIGERFKGASRSDLSWVGGLRMLLTFCAGIASSALHSRFGSRRLQMAGATIVCAATGFSSLATELWHLYVTFGALAGIGLSMVFTSASVAVDGLFNRYVHVALPLVQLGGAVGTSVFPASARAMVGALELRGSLYVLCGLSFTPALCALFYVDTDHGKPNMDKPNDSSNTTEEAVVADAFSASSARDPAAGELPGAATPSTSPSPSTQQALDLAQALHRSLGDCAESHGFTAAAAQAKTSADHQQAVADADEVADSYTKAVKAENELNENHACAIKKNHDRVSSDRHTTIMCDTTATTSATLILRSCDPLPPSKSLGILPAGDRLDDILALSAAATLTAGDIRQKTVIQPLKGDSLPTMTLTRSLPSVANVPEKSKSDATQLRRTLRLLATGDTWLGLLHFFSRQYASSAIVVLLPTLATSAGRLSAEAGTVSLTVLFAATVPGHVTTVALGARSFNRVMLAVVVCILLGSATMACSPALASVKTFYPLCAFAGYWLGMMLGLFMSVVKHMCGESARLADAFGLTAFASGLGGLAGPAVSGFLLTIAEPEMTLYATGGVAILAGVALIIPAVRRPKPVPIGEKAVARSADEADSGSQA